MYRVEKRQVMLIPVQVSASEPMERQFNSYLIEDVKFVENTFLRIRKLCGSCAAALLWMIYVEEKTQEDVAYQMGLTVRALQYSADKWLHKALLEDENDKG